MNFALSKCELRISRRSCRTKLGTLRQIEDVVIVITSCPPSYHITNISRRAFSFSIMMDKEMSSTSIACLSPWTMLLMESSSAWDGKCLHAILAQYASAEEPWTTCYAVGIYVRTAQRWARQYERDPNSIFEKLKNGRLRILNEEHKMVLLIRCYSSTVEAYGRLMYTTNYYGPNHHCHIAQICATDWIKVVLDASDQSTKLLIRTRTSNLVTSSVLIIDTQKNMQLGLSTKGYFPKDSWIYLDMESVASAKRLFSEGNCWRVDPHGITAQLRQVRSKFNRLSTFSLCRASSSVTDFIAYRPFTIWTLLNNDSNQVTESQARWVSRLFQSIALAVIKEGQNVRLKKADV